MPPLEDKSLRYVLAQGQGAWRQSESIQPLTMVIAGLYCQPHKCHCEREVVPGTRGGRVFTCVLTVYSMSKSPNPHGALEVGARRVHLQMSSFANGTQLPNGRAGI